MIDYRKLIQENLDYDDGYKLKSNKEIINIISDFGLGETEFHTADIERLLYEHSRMLLTLKQLMEHYTISGKDLIDESNKNKFINNINDMIEFYSEDI